MRRKRDGQELWCKYCYERNTYRSLAKNTKRSVKWVKIKLDASTLIDEKILPGETILVIDTTYFGREFGVMVFRCAIRKKNLWWKVVPYETNAEYQAGVCELEARGWRILGIVCDGRRGLPQLFYGILVQICQFHQLQVVTRYITRRPKLLASIELRNIDLLLTKTDEPSFSYWLQQWHEKWSSFLSEKSFDVQRKQFRFTHRRLRSAYQSLKTNLPYLFTHQQNPELNMPNTTNALEGNFSHLKEKIRLHRGLKKSRKLKLINQLLSSSNQPQKKVH